MTEYPNSKKGGISVIAMLALWLLAVYGLSTILIHGMMRWNGYEQAQQELKVHLLLYNSENCLEGTIRSLVHHSRLKGRPIQLVVYDYGSTDQTERILQTLKRENPFLLDQVELVSGGDVSLISLKQENPHSYMTIDLREGAAGGTFQTT